MTVQAELLSLALDFDHMGTNPIAVSDVNPSTLIVLNVLMRGALRNSDRDLRIRVLRRMTCRWPVLHSGTAGMFTSTKDLTFAAAHALISWLIADSHSYPPRLRPGAGEAVRALADRMATMPVTPAANQEPASFEDEAIQEILL